MPVRQTLAEGRVPVMVWTDELEESAARQLRNLATLPILHHHVAAMPDVHWGMGATVGSVLAMRGAIIPAAVGVDIGCFVGATEVFLTDGKRHRLEDLARRTEPFAIWACMPSGEVVAAVATATRTRAMADLIEVVLDNGEAIRCTPDHEFMLRSGNYCRADGLEAGVSLMPFYWRLDQEEYFRVQQPHSCAWQRGHWIVARSGLLGPVPKFAGQRTVIHHRNFVESDNTPENLQFMGDGDHAAYHRSIVDRNQYWQSPDFEARRMKAIAAKAATAEGHAYFAERGKKNILKYMTERHVEFLAAVAGNGVHGAPHLARFNKSERGREQATQRASKLHRCPECGEMVRSYIGLFNHRRRAHQAPRNHKVVSVRTLRDRAPVYCLSVPGHFNFALAAGVFVHNCGMCAVRLSLRAEQLPDSLGKVRAQIERDVPVGFAEHGDARLAIAPADVSGLQSELTWLREAHPAIRQRDDGKVWRQVGSLGGGNHFIELCLDGEQRVWVMLHSGSRNVGKVIAEHFVTRAKQEAERRGHELPDKDLAWLPEESADFRDYVRAVSWAQDYAMQNRRTMLRLVLGALARHLPAFTADAEAINCHHNYVSREHHFGADVLVTRKGAIRAGLGDLGIIPGSMGTRSYIVRGKGSADSFESCSHGAGRRMSRGEAKRRLSVHDLRAQTEGVECRKDEGVLDEAPAAYKDIDVVMAHQADLVEIVHELKQVLCVKG